MAGLERVRRKRQDEGKGGARASDSFDGWVYGLYAEWWDWGDSVRKGGGEQRVGKKRDPRSRDGEVGDR